MIENIDNILDRGERLELLVDKTANMQGNTFRFRKQTRRFNNTVWWRNCKLTYVFINRNSLPCLHLKHDFKWFNLFDAFSCVLSLVGYS